MCEHLFLHYGAGRALFNPIKRLSSWNVLLWVIIALAIVGWLALFMALGAFKHYDDSLLAGSRFV